MQSPLSIKEKSTRCSCTDSGGCTAMFMEAGDNTTSKEKHRFDKQYGGDEEATR